MPGAAFRQFGPPEGLTGIDQIVWYLTTGTRIMVSGAVLMMIIVFGYLTDASLDCERLIGLAVMAKTPILYFLPSRVPSSSDYFNPVGNKVLHDDWNVRYIDTSFDVY